MKYSRITMDNLHMMLNKQLQKSYLFLFFTITIKLYRVISLNLSQASSSH